MAAQKYKLIASLLVVSCSNLNANPNLILHNNISGCFVASEPEFKASGEMSTAQISVSDSEKFDCPCKSALVSYSATQTQQGNISTLLTGTFTTLGKETVVLPVAVQNQLIFKDSPVNLSFKCASP